MTITLNNKKYTLNLEEYKTNSLFMEYRERLLYMVGYNASKNIIDEANTYLLNKYPQYSIFINR